MRLRKHEEDPQSRPRRRFPPADQGCGEAPAGAVAARLPARRHRARRRHPAHRLRHRRQRFGGEGAARDVEVQRPRPGADLQSDEARADLSGKRDHAAVSVQRLLPGRGRAGRRGRDLHARGRRHGRREEDLEPRGALRAAAGEADHAPHLHRGLERDRLVDRHAAARFPEARSAPISRRNTSGSSAPRAMRRRSTCRPRCIRRPR